jgi:hypothetical protein
MHGLIVPQICYLFSFCGTHIEKNFIAKKIKQQYFDSKFAFLRAEQTDVATTELGSNLHLLGYHGPDQIDSNIHGMS